MYKYYKVILLIYIIKNKNKLKNFLIFINIIYLNFD